MKNEKRLLIARNIFAFIVFVALGVIVVTEKGKDILIPKNQKEMEKYLEEKYPELKDNIETNEVTFKNNAYTMTVSSKENKKLYFSINKKHQEIIDTYKKDYLEGETLLSSLKEKIQEEIKKQISITPEIIINSTLDQYTEGVRERIISENNLLELKFYTVKDEIKITNWKKEDITKEISNYIKQYEEKLITPKSYTIIITNKKDITESIQIENISPTFIEDKENIQMIQDILDDHQSKLLKEKKITFKYLN